MSLFFFVQQVDNLHIPGVSHGYTSDSETFRGRTTCGYTSEGGVDLGEIIIVIYIDIKIIAIIYINIMIIIIMINHEQLLKVEVMQTPAT